LKEIWQLVELPSTVLGALTLFVAAGSFFFVGKKKSEGFGVCTATLFLK